MKHFIKQIWLVSLCGVILSSCYTSKIYIVRHAERLDQSEDTPLSAAGYLRAEALTDSLKLKKIDSIFVTKYQRNRYTAKPLADYLGKQMIIYEPKPNDIIVKRLGYLKGKNALVVGHSDTILEITKGLGTLPSLPKIESTDYDNLFVITVKKTLFGTKRTLEEKTYGVETKP